MTPQPQPQAPLDPERITVDDVFASAERVGAKITRDGWGRIRNSQLVYCCPLAALAVDRDPTILRRRGRVAAAKQVLGFSEEFVDGVVRGFDFGRQGIWNTPDYLRGYQLGRACLKRICPDLVRDDPLPGKDASP